ncbi:MAG: Lipoprotein-releasing system transmembrane protein LolE [Alphaproteobacteria bacterium MarineAlpha9_Bin4]|nr:lipoprotein-releasing system transmembrane subunit LolC [Pelagibacterales bacterium]PPR27539.1 MAG: Lipoprotein-releasing system transmembrane protein LolE [Alphaproteobacteria bacterium MarineAlpha9_Bin4]|tara:strand:+ start:541 stop:1782 length:1242 start_codon:yes stop_codon:yes gene_type:complete
MNFNLETFIALRYLKSKRDERFISISSFFSFTGITIGVATLIIVMSVMNGFRIELLDKIIGVNGHAVIYINSKKSIDINKLADDIQEITNVEYVAKEFEFNAMVANKNLSAGVLVKGVDKADLLERNSISDNIISGSLDNFNNKSLIIGTRLASYLNINVNDKITLLTSNKTETPFGSVPITDEYKVVSIFEVGMYDYDRGVLFLPRSEAINLVRSERDVTQLEIFFIENNNFQKTMKLIENLIGEKGKIFSWKSLHKELFSALEIEKKVMFLILFLIIFVAAFNLISSIIMIVKDKERGIGILRSLGVKRSEIQRIFIFIGSVVGLFGTTIGTILGIFISFNIGKIQIFLEGLLGSKLFSAEVYFFNIIPSKIDYTEVFMIFFISLLLSILSTIYPSWKASKIEPANVLRYE